MSKSKGAFRPPLDWILCAAVGEVLGVYRLPLLHRAPRAINHTPISNRYQSQANSPSADARSMSISVWRHLHPVESVSSAILKSATALSVLPFGMPGKAAVAVGQGILRVGLDGLGIVSYKAYSLPPACLRSFTKLV
jgi:hypothetical protein